MTEATKKPTYGEVKQGLFLRECIGDGETDEGINFEIAIGIANRAPMVIVGNRAFMLSWNDIVNLANDAGLFKSEVTE